MSEVFEIYFGSDDYQFFCAESKVKVVESDEAAQYLKLSWQNIGSRVEKEVFLGHSGVPLCSRRRRWDSAGEVQCDLWVEEKDWMVRLLDFTVTNSERWISFIFATTAGNKVASSTYHLSGELIQVHVEPYFTFGIQGGKPELFREEYSPMFGFCKDGSAWNYFFQSPLLHSMMEGKLEVGQKVVDPSGTFEYRIALGDKEDLLQFTGTELATGKAITLRAPLTANILFWHQVVQTKGRDWRWFADQGLPAVPELSLPLPKQEI